MKNKKNLSLYIHIPFCIQKCKYCDFLSFSSLEEDRNSYIQELQKELIFKSKSTKEYQVISVFFGGGTPSILRVDQMQLLMKTIFEYYDVLPDAEITMEGNPGTLTREKLYGFRKSGINRLSIGLQSADDEELRRIGRIHTFAQMEENFYHAREVGFTNINIDLMSALPGQTLESYEKTLEQVIGLNPEHISAYSLIVEEGTPLADDDKLLSQLPDENIDREMYQLTKTFLHQRDYERYEISNYAKAGYECLHNKVYWTGGAYLGFGLGASSYFHGQRFSNETNLKNYRFDGDKQEVQILSNQDQIEEFMFLGMRLTKGVSKKRFFEKFGQQMDEIYGNVFDKQEKEGLIVNTKERVYLTEKGLDVSNYVFCDYLQ
jgi:oxygen-independent coproporphyrinogen-3 oxidase